MAVVNRTPDSFFDRGRTFALDARWPLPSPRSRRGRTGSTSVEPVRAGGRDPGREELDRVLPVIAALRAGSDAVISVDTFHAEVAKRAIPVGGKRFIDTTGLSDSGLVPVVADSEGDPRHHPRQAAPRTAYPRPRYDDVVAGGRRVPGRAGRACARRRCARGADW